VPSLASSSKLTPEPILKWPGGKRWLTPLVSEILKRELDGCYYEPFLGGGAVFLAVNPDTAVLSDTNSQLIDFYETCVSDPKKVSDLALQHPNSEECYYRVRSSRPRLPETKAGRFLYLNKTCWGGVYRLNRLGQFNVPFGKSGRKICNRESVELTARLFGAAVILCCDFAESFQMTQKGDVVFADPPYTSRGQFNGFVRYNEKLFSWQDQVRLSKAAKAARRRGTFVTVCGSFHRDVLSLYERFWVLEVRRKSCVAKCPDARRTVSECLIFSRKPKANVSGLQRVSSAFLRSVPHGE